MNQHSLGVSVSRDAPGWRAPRPLALLFEDVLLHFGLGSGPMSALLLAAAAAHVAAFAGTGALRAIFPFPIDGVEPGAIQEVRRVLAGQPIYVAPELGYVPFIYPPVYFYVSALFGAVSGSALLGMRIASLLASLGSITLVTLLVRRETGSLGIGLVAGGTLAACGPLVDFAMDIGRMDALLLFLMLAAIYVVRMAVEPTAGWRLSAAGGVLMGLALLTKQSGAPVAAALMLLLVILRRDQLLAFAVAMGAVVGLTLLALTLQSGQWPLFYLWELPRRHELRRELIMHIWSDVLSRFTLPLVVGPFYLFGRALARDRTRLVFYSIVTLCLLGTSWVSYSNIGGGRNVLLPAYAGFSVLFALGLHEALSRLSAGMARPGPIRAYLLCVGIAQLAVLIYNPRLIVPYSSDRWDGERLAATLTSLPGPIFAGSYEGYLGNANAFAPDLGAVSELEGAFGGGGVSQASDFEGMLAGGIVQRRFTYLIVDPDNSAAIVSLLAEAYGYKRAGPLFPEGDIYWAWRTGWAPKADVWVRPNPPGG